MQTGKLDRFKILVCTELFFSVILFTGCFGEERLIHSFQGKDLAGQMISSEQCQEVESDQIELTPGVYRLKAQTNLAPGQSILIDVRAEEASYKSLRNNGMTIFAGNDQVQFMVYVLDRIPKAYIHFELVNSDMDSLVLTELYQTKLGNRMFLFLFIILSLILDFLIVFRKGIVEKRISVKQQIVFWTLTAGVLLSFFPCLTDYITIADDTVFHLERIAFLKDALEQGSFFPVRMQGTWLYGHGYATSLFYGELFLYIPACLMLLGFSVMSAYKIFLFIVLTATAGIAYHCFKKCVGDEYAALFGSMFCLLIPYHLFNIYNRGAAGEYLAMAFYPMVFCGMYLLYTRDVMSEEYGKYKWYVILGMSAVLQCHLISTVMTAIIMAIVCVVFWKKTFRKQTFCQLLEAVSAVLLLNAWFWIPLLYMMGADTYILGSVIQREGQNWGTLIANYFQMLPNGGNTQTGMRSVYSIHIGAGGFAILAFYCLWRWRHREEKSRICSILATFSVLLLIASTQYIPWDVISKIPGIGYFVGTIQFPYRWMAPATVVVGMFAAFFFKLIKEKAGRLSKTALGLIAVISVGSAVFQVNDLAVSHSPAFLYNAENMGTAGIVYAEYLLAETAMEDLCYHRPVAEEGLIWSDYDKCGTNVTVSLDNTTNETRHIELPLLGYKGYGIRQEKAVDGNSPYITEERGSHGDLRIAVPGRYQGSIRVSYQGIAAFHVAEAISMVSLLVILGVCFCRKKNRNLLRQAEGGYYEDGKKR